MKKLSHLKKWLFDNNLRKEFFMISKSEIIQKKAVTRVGLEPLKKWMKEHGEELSFEELFNGANRIVIPFNNKQEEMLLRTVLFLKDKGWEPAGGGNTFNVKTVEQKQRELGSGEEYIERKEVAELKIIKKEKFVIPAGPKKGQETERQTVSSITKVLQNPKYNAPEDIISWWKKKQTLYANNYNWKQIEYVFKKGKIDSSLSIIISREPIDVLRMSDHYKIQSCHSEGNSYFGCAITEAKGNGLVSYIVRTEDLNEILTVHSPWGWDPNTGKGPEKLDISAFDGKEIFLDRERGVRGISPESRLRLRKFLDVEEDIEFAAPEDRTYGPHPPGFKEAVRKWAWENQKHLFELGDGEYYVPRQEDLEMYGGSYRDTPDGEVLNKFFAEGGIATDFYGNVETISDDEQTIFDMWEEEISQTNELAQEELEHVTFLATVDDVDGAPHIYTWAEMEITIPLSGWEDIEIEGGLARTTSGLRPIPLGFRQKNWLEISEFKNILDHDMASHIVEYDIEDMALVYKLNFECYDCNNPDEVYEFFQDLKSGADASYEEIREKTRKELIEKGYISENVYDRVGRSLNNIDFENFNIYGGADDDYDGEILIQSDPDAFKMNIPIPASLHHAASGFGENPLEKILNAEKEGRYNYILKDELFMIFDTIKRISEQAEEEAKQISFPFYKEKPINYLREIKNISLKAEIYADSGKIGKIKSVSLEIKASGYESDEYLIFIENLIKRLDTNADYFKYPIRESLEKKISMAEKEVEAKAAEFYNNEVKSLVNTILSFKDKDNDIKIMDDAIAKWIDYNWKYFNILEKVTAYKDYLVKMSEGQSPYYSLNIKSKPNAPPQWSNDVQKKGAPIGYRWTGKKLADFISKEQKEYSKEEEA